MKVTFDARDAFVSMPHGSGIYVARLLEALQRNWPSELELDVVREGGRGPEVVFEQALLPWRTRRSALLHCPDTFLPLVRRCPGVVTIHDLAFITLPGDMPARTEAKYRQLVPRIARSADRVIVPSAFTAADVCDRLGVARERVRVIPEAAALPAGNREPPVGDYILAAGDLRPKKNLAMLIAAFNTLSVPHRLVLAGLDFGSGAALHRLTGASPVDFVGFVDDAELDALIRGAAAVVVPSVYEGFGLVALDAMARGIPVVLAKAGALPEPGGDAALYFNPYAPDDLAAVLQRLLTSPAELAARGRASAARAAEFSWERTAELTLAVYRELL